jgi:type III secretion protein Q
LLVGGQLRFAARLENGVLAVEGKTMTVVAKPPEPAADALAEIEAVEVELQAQVGRLTVTLGQLRRLGAGQVVEFSTPIESPAILAVGGKTVAVGELVDVGGRVGVRITAMAE